VTGEQARLLNLAREVGNIYLTLRAMNDKHRVEEKELFDPRFAERVESSKDEERDVPVPVARPAQGQLDPKPGRKKWKIEIIAGSDRRIEEVDLPDEKPVTQNPATGS
jgi:hypothetical protein